MAAGGACLYFFFLARDLGSCCGCEAGSPVRERQPRQRSGRVRSGQSNRAVA
jgi:hypothetical protein